MESELIESLLKEKELLKKNQNRDFSNNKNSINKKDQTSKVVVKKQTKKPIYL